MCEARRDIFLRMVLVSNPGVSRSTKKPRTACGSSSSSLAQTTARWQIGAFVIHILAPLRTYASPSWRAMVRMEPGSEPESGSVSPKHPITSPLAMRGSQCCLGAEAVNGIHAQ